MAVKVELGTMELRNKEFIKSVLDMPPENRIPIVEGIIRDDNISTQMGMLTSTSRNLLNRELEEWQMVELTRQLEEILIDLKRKKRKYIEKNK